MPELAAWQDQHANLLTIAVVAGGEQDRNREKAAEHGLTLMLLQSGREVAEAYQAYGTPAAVVIDTNGLVASPTVGGADAIRALVAQATRRVLHSRQLPLLNGNRGAPRGPAPDALRIGEPAPELVLEDLDNQPIELKNLYGGRTVALFWNPGCGFCQRMLPELHALEERPAPGAPQVVVISAGDAQSVRQQQIRSRVLLDTDGKAMRAFAAGGTPMGVLVSEGRIASDVAAGADAVLELIRSATVSPARNGSGR
jgi:thiol-disulfide isomerase/thioredoxin